MEINHQKTTIKYKNYVKIVILFKDDDEIETVLIAKNTFEDIPSGRLMNLMGKKLTEFYRKFIHEWLMSDLLEELGIYKTGW